MNRPDRDRSYTIAAPQVTSEEFDGEHVVLDLESGRYFSFSGGAALVWQGLVAGCDPGALGAELPEGSPSRTAFDSFVSSVIDAGLIREREVSAGADAQALAARIAASDGGFAFDGFDDLAALLVADPIHDVEHEAGWPHNEQKKHG